MFVLLFLVVALFLIYFISMVCIQFNYICNINLLLSSNLDQLDATDEMVSINYIARNFALKLYKFHSKFKEVVKG